MKNAYELAETILKSRLDKNGELKSSDSFSSIELYGTSACKKAGLKVEKFEIRKGMPTLGIITIIFFVQRFGTESIGKSFGVFMLCFNTEAPLA